MKALILSVGVVSLLALGGQNAFACSCSPLRASEIASMPAAEVAKRIAASHATIFYGRVIKRSEAKWAYGTALEVTFEVERYWKGANTKRISIYTSLTEASCGAPYQIGKKYLVIAMNLKDKLYTGYCEYLGATKLKDLYLSKFGSGERPHTAKPNKG